MAGISQEALGEKLGITFQQIQKYEKGSNRISAPILVELATIFNVDILDFFAGCSRSNGIRGIRSSPIPNMNPKTVYLVERLTAMPAGEARDGLFKLIDALSDD